MEETTVLIVGAGPSGLALAVNLGHMNIPTVIIDKEIEVNQDPRGVVIVGDAVRISHQLGIGPALTEKIGQPIGSLLFHHRDFKHPVFLEFDLTRDWLQQSTEATIAQFQPNFEQELRDKIAQLSSTDLRSGCEVVDRTEEQDAVVVIYKERDGSERVIRARWVVGADGKRGVVRKAFLEPEGIKQDVGLFKYEATWIAANFKITLPTPISHPRFPLWELGYTPEEVYEKFWPKGFHFCNDPTRPAVSGRFGLKMSRFWRHEFLLEDKDIHKDQLDELWNHFEPWITRPMSDFRGGIGQDTVQFPRECIEVLRCRSFRFAAKVVNRWFCRRTILIGDAAHVFPPFGGQGIAAGMRDAQSLSWRLALIERVNLSPPSIENLLEGWSQEQRQVVDRATLATMDNGKIVNQRSPVFSFLFGLLMRVLWMIPGLAARMTNWSFGDHFQFADCKNGLFLSSSGAAAGRRLPQIWIRNGDGVPCLSDSIILRQRSQLALLILVDEASEVKSDEIAQMLKETRLPEPVLSMKSVTFLSRRSKAPEEMASSALYYPCTRVELAGAGIQAINDYDEMSLKNRVGGSARYVIVRPDFFVHSVARTEEEFKRNTEDLRRKLFEVQQCMG